jgi:hypothetical protein
LTLSSNAETNFVLGLVTTFSASDYIWIGGTDGRFSGDGPGSGPYAWITGEPMVYQNWYTNGATQEPDGRCDFIDSGKANCEHRLAIGNDGRWSDVYEALAYRFVCEADL